MSSDPHSFGAALVAASWWLLVGCAAWAALICLAAVLEATSRGRLRATTWVRCPPALSRVLLAGLGVALVSVPGQAAALSSQRGPGLADPYDAASRTLPVPTRPLGPAQAHTAQVVVRPGDSLWHLAEHRVPAKASAAEILDLVARLHRRNRAVIGPDPDLIRPGQRLVVPRSPGRAHSRLKPVPSTADTP